MDPSKKSRPKASQIPDEAMLRACESWSDKRFPYPLDAFPEMPNKVKVAKLHKLRDRGLVDGKYNITRPGRTVLEGLDMDTDAQIEASA